MNYTREQMLENGGNIEWCKPLFTEDMKYCVIKHEGEYSKFYEIGQDEIKETEKTFPLEDLIEKGCCKCPFFLECDAMDDID